MFFPGSVRGLNKGAPVTFRGVKIGEVKDVTAFLTGRDDQLDPDRGRDRGPDATWSRRPRACRGPSPAATAEELAEALIARGVRARMLSQSLLTGQKYIDLDFLPDEPARLAGHQARATPSCPRRPTAMEKLGDRAETFFAKLAELPLDQMLEDVRKALQSLREVLSSPDLKGALAGAHRATRSLEPTLADARAAIAGRARPDPELDGRVKGIGSDSEATLREMRETLEQAQQTLETLERTLVGSRRGTRSAAPRRSRSWSAPCKAIRNLVDYIQTHPEAVVQGKPQRKEKK